MLGNLGMVRNKVLKTKVLSVCGGGGGGIRVCENKQPQGLGAEEMPLVICPGGKTLFHRYQTHAEVLFKIHLFIYCVYMCTCAMVSLWEPEDNLQAGD